MNGLISLAAVMAMLRVAGGAIGFLDRPGLAWRWPLAATALVTLNDVLLPRCCCFDAGQA